MIRSGTGVTVPRTALIGWTVHTLFIAAAFMVETGETGNAFFFFLLFIYVYIFRSIYFCVLLCIRLFPPFSFLLKIKQQKYYKSSGVQIGTVQTPGDTHGFSNHEHRSNVAVFDFMLVHI